MPLSLAAKIQKKHKCPSVGVMVGAVKLTESKITWETGLSLLCEFMWEDGPPVGNSIP